MKAHHGRPACLVLAAAGCVLAASVLAGTSAAAPGDKRADARWVSTRPLLSVDFVTATRGWAGGRGGVVLRTTTGGTTWKVQRRYSSTGPDLHDMAFVSRARGWVVGTAGYVARTTDGGAHWRRQANGLFTENLLSVRFRNASDGYACGGFVSQLWDDAHQPYGAILHTANGGRTWNKTDFAGFCPLALDYDDATGFAYAIGIVRNQTSPTTGFNYVGYVGTNDGAIWTTPQAIPNIATVLGTPWGFDVRGGSWVIVGADESVSPARAIALFSVDAMSSWGTVTFPSASTFTDVRLTSASTAHIVGLTNQVWKTTDYGTSWSPKSLPIGGYPSDLDFVSSATGYVAGSWGTPTDYGRIYKTVNGGGRWVRKR